MRHNTRKAELKGIFVGAKVVRGFNWEWGNQDGGEGKSEPSRFPNCLIHCFEGKMGRVLDIRGWDNETSRSVANVTWFSGSTNVYRLGHKGNCDIKFIEPGSGGTYYPDHLPILGNCFIQHFRPNLTFNVWCFRSKRGAKCCSAGTCGTSTV